MKAMDLGAAPSTVGATLGRSRDETGERIIAGFASVGSPYVTLRYQGIAPVLGIGQGITPRLTKARRMCFSAASYAAGHET